MKTKLRKKVLHFYKATIYAGAIPLLSEQLGSDLELTRMGSQTEERGLFKTSRVWWVGHALCLTSLSTCSWGIDLLGKKNYDCLHLRRISDCSQCSFRCAFVILYCSSRT